MRPLIPIILATAFSLAASACSSETSSAAAGIIGASCFSVDAPANTRVEIVDPHFIDLDATKGNIENSHQIELKVAKGKAPLVLVLRGAGAPTYTVSGAVERVIAVMADANIKRPEGLPEKAVFAPDRPRSIYATCAGTINADRLTLPDADARVLEITGRHIHDLHDDINASSIEVGHEEWVVRMFSQEAVARYKNDQYYKVDDQKAASFALMRQHAERTGSRLPSELAVDENGCAPPVNCAALRQLIRRGEIRLVSNSDLDRWKSAARAGPIGHLWAVSPYQTNSGGYTILKPTTIPAGMHGAQSATFFIEKGVPAPRDPGSHNRYFDIGSGKVYGLRSESLPR